MAFKIIQENKPEAKQQDFKDYCGFVRDCDDDLHLTEFDGNGDATVVVSISSSGNYLSLWEAPEDLLNNHGPLRKVDAELIIKG